jgi:hypothetical protein
MIRRGDDDEDEGMKTGEESRLRESEHFNRPEHQEEEGKADRGREEPSPSRERDKDDE